MDYVKIVKDLIVEPIESAGYILDDVSFEKEGNVYFLRIVIDKEGFITIDDCCKVTHIINPILDENDPISESYILDVSSKEKGEQL